MNLNYNRPIYIIQHLITTSVNRIHCSGPDFSFRLCVYVCIITGTIPTNTVCFLVDVSLKYGISSPLFSKYLQYK